MESSSSFEDDGSLFYRDIPPCDTDDPWRLTVSESASLYGHT